MSFAVKPHLPLISNRIQFNFQVLQPPPTITLRQDHGKYIKRQVRRNRTPYECKIQARRSTTPSAPIDSELSELSSDEGSEDEEETAGESKGRIPKPPGEAGRSNCGGFNLEKALNWDGDKYDKMTVSRNKRIEILTNDDTRHMSISWLAQCWKQINASVTRNRTLSRM